MKTETNKKEWGGELGYSNCALVTMARVGIAYLEISTKTLVPNLEELAKNMLDTYQWLRTQEINYEKLSSVEVINILSKTAGLSTGIFGKKSGIINVHDVQKDNGPIIQSKYYLSLSKKNGIISLKISLPQNENK